MLLFCLSGFFYIQPLFSYFHWRDWQAACIILLHVAWPTKRAEQIGFRPHFSSAPESGLSRRLSWAKSRLNCDCHTMRHEYCTETSGGAWPQDSAEKADMTQEQDYNLSLLPYTGLVLTKGVSIVDMERKETSRKSKRRNTKTSPSQAPSCYCRGTASRFMFDWM
jgi:hypothetical protein